MIINKSSFNHLKITRLLLFEAKKMFNFTNAVGKLHTLILKFAVLLAIS